MLVLPEYSKPYMIDSVNAPLVIKNNWIFSGPMLDFMLSPITYLEETTGEAVKVRINGSEFWVPSTWYILVTDPETYQIDTVNIRDCAKKKHIAFSFAPDEMNLRTLDVTVIDAIGEDDPPMSLVHPMITKGTALVHPVGPSAPLLGRIYQLSVVIGPHDLYKYLSNKVVGDILSY